MHSYSVKYPVQQQKEKIVPKKGVKQFLTSIENNSERTNNTEVVHNDQIKKELPKIALNPIQSVLSFLEKLTFYNDVGKIFIHVVQEKKERKYQYLLLNPSSQFEKIIKEARSVRVILK